MDTVKYIIYYRNNLVVHKKVIKLNFLKHTHYYLLHNYICSVFNNIFGLKMSLEYTSSLLVHFYTLYIMKK